MKSMKRINRSSYRLDEKDLAYEEASEESGFIELPVGTPVATFRYKRCYQFRESTVRMLNELKAAHPDVNVYLNTILDEAIRHYYKYFFHKNKDSR
jgi:hypothetical protein